ncbi:MAG: hypothetical protein HC880_18905, partial [Bacteroidia bacterium]|nr:hypothetical protein [Bacteroidia bacterium]
MIVNGSYDPESGLPPGKVWCQTIERDPADPGYYVFTVWVQNLISGGRNLDIPQLRLTVCDMEDPASRGLPGVSGTLDVVNPVLGINGLVEGTTLPGITLARQTPVQHMPLPPINRLQDPRVEHPYGAAMPCNIPGEPKNSRLKVLGSSFIINENPDGWRVLRCIYRAPAGVAHMNICVENLSLT